MKSSCAAGLKKSFLNQGNVLDPLSIPDSVSKLQIAFKNFLNSQSKLEISGGILLMNKAQIVDQLAKEHTISKTQAESVLNSTLDIIKKSVKKGDVVTLVGFGSFFKAKRKARKGRNPQTGAELKIPAHNVPKFRPGMEFKKAVK